MRAKAGDLCAYDVRRGGDGKMGIYLRGYNVRLAIFNANSASLQTALLIVFDRANRRAVKKAKPR